MTTPRRYNLTPTEYKVLAKIQFSAHLSLRDFARSAKIPEHSIRYVLKKLQNDGIISRTICINLYTVGHSSALVYFSLSKNTGKLRNELLNYLNSLRQVSWLAELVGDYEYGMAVSVKSPNDLQVFLAKLTGKFLSLFKDKAVVFQTGIALFPRKYLWKEFSGTEELYSSSLQTNTTKFDDLDIKIIGTICDHPGASLRDLGKYIGKTHSTIEKRIEKLKKNKIIVGEYFRVEGSVLGYQTYKLFIYTSGINLVSAQQMRLFCRKHQLIIYMIECIGTWDYEIGVEALKPEDVTLVVQELNDLFSQHISSIKTAPVLRPIKFQYYSNS